MAIRKAGKLVIISVALVAVAAGVACWVWSGLNAVATLEPGMVELNLPSGATAYLRRQAYFAKPAVVYISANPSFCAPYDRWHDYELPPIVHGGPDSPALISFTSNTIIVHNPEPVREPWSTRPSSFNVRSEKITPEVYATYVGNGNGAAELPESWMRIEIPFGHNTCAP